MSNSDLQLLWEYHNRTKHSYQSVRSSGHLLDWANQPHPFKIYPDLPPIPLPRDWPSSNIEAIAAISASQTAEPSISTPELPTLASILFHSAGITRRRSYVGGEIYFRAAACTGALYEVDLYLVCGAMPDLEAGVYHFNPADFTLRQLCSGDFRSLVARSTANEPSVIQAPVTIVCTGTYWRNAWKYQARTYRHFFWDNGTILANLLVTAAALRLPTELVLGFVDEEVNELLDLDTEREVALSLVALGKGDAADTEVPGSLSTLNYAVEPYSLSEVDYPIMRQAHQASSLSNQDEVKQWRGRTAVKQGPNADGGRLIELTPMPRTDLPTETIEQVIRKRGSTRQFARELIPVDKLSTILLAATQGISADILKPVGTRLNDLYLIVNAVEGLHPGTYVLKSHRQSLELLREGSFRNEAGRLGLDQALPADASVAIFFLADLRNVLESYGNRGYRAAQMEAGIIGGKIYLASYALGLGATGLTFYDDEVVDFFSPHAAGKSAIFLTAVGIPAKRHLKIA